MNSTFGCWMLVALSIYFSFFVLFFTSLFLHTLISILLWVQSDLGCCIYANASSKRTMNSGFFRSSSKHTVLGAVGTTVAPGLVTRPNGGHFWGWGHGGYDSQQAHYDRNSNTLNGAKRVRMQPFIICMWMWIVFGLGGGWWQRDADNKKKSYFVYQIVWHVENFVYSIFMCIRVNSAGQIAMFYFIFGFVFFCCCCCGTHNWNKWTDKSLPTRREIIGLDDKFAMYYTCCDSFSCRIGFTQAKREKKMNYINK